MKKILFGVVGISFALIGYSANAQFDDSIGAQYKKWATSEMCRMGGEGVTMMQAHKLVPMMAMGGKAPLRVLQDVQRMLQLDQSAMENIDINILNNVYHSCPNRIGRSEYDMIKREVDYYKSSGSICKEWQFAYAKGSCLKN